MISDTLKKMRAFNEWQRKNVGMVLLCKKCRIRLKAFYGRNSQVMIRCPRCYTEYPFSEEALKEL